MLLVLTLILLVIFILHYRITRDILRPGLGIALSFILATLSAYYNKDFWGNDISATTMAIIVLATFIYVFIDLLSYSFFEKNKISQDKSTGNIIRVGIIQYFVTLAIMAVSSLIYYRDVINVVSSNGVFGDWNSSIRYYRNAGVTGELEEGVSGLATNLYLLSTAITYVFLYIFIHNIIVKRNNKFNYFNLVPVALYFVNTILTGGRMPILRLVIGGIFIYLFLLIKSTGRAIPLKSLFRIFVIVVVFLWGFALISEIVGRSYDYNALYYITSYIGGSIILFDLFIGDPVTHTIFGYETFPSILKFLGGTFNNSDWSGVLVNKEFRISDTGESLGNVYTALRAYISDFGYGGMVVLVVIHAIIFLTLYHFLRKHKVRWGELDMFLLIYMYIIHAIYLFAIDDRFFMDILSVGTVKVFILIFIVKYLLTGIRFKDGKVEFKKIIGGRAK